MPATSIFLPESTAISSSMTGSAVFTNAKNTADRLMRFNGIEAEALYHPPPLAGRYRDDGPGSYGLVVGRLDPWKRMDLAIEGAAAG